MADVGSANINITADDSQAQSTISGFMGSLKRIGGIAAAVTGGLALFETAKSTFSGLWTATIGANSGMESYRNTLATVLKSWEKADQTLAWVETFAAKTPFEIPELVEATTRLETYGITAKDTLGSIGDMASVMGKPLMQAVEAVADAQTGELERLKEFGITKQMLIDKALAMGKGEIVNAKGQITNQKALNDALFAIMNERYSGGMELQSKTFKGMISNAKDSMAQIAREMSRPVFDGLKSALAGVLPVMGALASYVKGDVNGAIEQLKSSVGPDLTNRILLAIDIVQSLFYETKEMFMNLAPAVNNLKAVFANIAPILGVVGVAIERAFYKLTDILPPIVNKVIELAAKLTGWSGFIPVVAGLAAAFATFRVIVAGTAAAQAAFAAVTKAVTLAMNIQRAAMMVYMATGGGLRGVLAALTVVQRALNLTLLANPIALVVAALVGLGVALYVAYQKSETFRNIVNNAWASVKAGFQSFLNFFTTTLPAWASNVAAGFGRMKDQAIARIQELISSGVAKWNSFKASVTAVISSWVAAALNLFNSMKSRTSSVISALVSGAVNLFNSLRARVMSIIQPFITFFVNSFRNLQLMVLGIVGFFLAALTGDFEGMKRSVLAIVTALQRQAVNIFNLIKNTIVAAVKNLATGAINNFNQFKSGAIAAVTALKNGAVNGIKSLVSNGKQLFEDLKNRSISSVKALGTGAINGFNSLKNGAINAVKNLVSSVVNFFKNLRSNATSQVNSTKSAIVNGFNSARSAATSAISGMVSSISSYVRSIPGKFVSMKNSILSTIRSINLYEIGKNIVKGLLNGLGSMLSSVKNKAKEISNTVQNAIKDRLKIKSPSRITMGFGIDTVKGLIIGMNDLMGRVKKQAANVAEAAIPPVQKIAAPSISGMQNGSGLSSTLRNIGMKFADFASGSSAAVPASGPYVLQVNLNGRKIAEETYADIRDLQNRAEARSRRARGEVV